MPQQTYNLYTTDPLLILAMGGRNDLAPHLSADCDLSSALETPSGGFGKVDVTIGGIAFVSKKNTAKLQIREITLKFAITQSYKALYEAFAGRSGNTILNSPTSVINGQSSLGKIDGILTIKDQLGNVYNFSENTIQNFKSGILNNSDDNSISFEVMVQGFLQGL